VAVQLDYYMSLQFAGIACALMNGTCELTWHPPTHFLLRKNYLCQVVCVAVHVTCVSEEEGAMMMTLSHKRLQ
jgi:hypothetical protein